jgi:hypothetical protein
MITGVNEAIDLKPFRNKRPELSLMLELRVNLGTGRGQVLMAGHNSAHG